MKTFWKALFPALGYRYYSVCAMYEHIRGYFYRPAANYIMQRYHADEMGANEELGPWVDEIIEDDVELSTWPVHVTMKSVRK